MEAKFNMRSGFAFVGQIVLVNNWLQVIDLVLHIYKFDVRSHNLMAIKPTGPNYHMIYIASLNGSK
jgi:hypothetical protein